ncbi:RNA-binding domain-containing protein [Rhizodiscina lignyota]|uniref:RNA-binding domain-containing protein n=1 Tax=Rhizodiscina lignyota TaxID=1504668 RepID=A0A9P4I2F1_9PEZI|nr:RNA-binding domain-containing protein [Rhizodiscina lignyota]
MDDQGGVPLPRSRASMNWRRRDETPRAEHVSQPDGDFQNGRGQNGSRKSQRTDDSPDSVGSGTRLYVGNLLYKVQREDVESFFTSNGFNICGMSMSIDPFTGRNPSYAFVDFETQDEANNAKEALNGAELLGRPVKINDGVKKSEGGDRFQSRVKNWGRGGVNDYKPTFDRWTRDDAPSHYVKPLEQGCRAFIGNLPRIEPQAAVDAEMQQVFSGFELAAVSKIINPLRDQPERASEKGNHYFCFVDFQTPEEAERAIAECDQKTGSWGGAVRVAKAKDNRDRKVIREQFGGDRRSSAPKSQ